MKRWILFLTLSMTALLVPATAESTALACFDFDCTQGAVGYCTFNASCSSGTPFIWKYNWDYGDGTSTGLTGQSAVSHTYGNICYPGVTLTVYTWDGDIESVQCLIDNRRSCPGPPLSTSGRCSQ